MLRAALNSTKKKIKDILPQRLVMSHLPKQASNCILLTFDDGPHPETTQRVLKLLKEYSARAIFFVVGQRIEKASYLLKHIQEQGHIIGNHTYIHSDSRQPWLWAYFLDLLHCQAVIEKQTGNRPRLFRPAGGRISTASLLAPRLLGMRTVSWSLEANDWRCRTTQEAQQAAELLINKLKSGDIVLLHDDNPHILEILDIVLPLMRSQKINLYNGIDFID